MQFLHENNRFKDLIDIVATEENVHPSFVEKDYWIMQVLWGLDEQGFDFYLKGGTSLSKGYNAIFRFSEDLDIMITPPEKMEVKSGKNHSKPAHVESRKRYFDWLIKEINIVGIENPFFDPDRVPDGKHRNADIVLSYPSVTEKVPKLKKGILLEVGFDQVEPFTKIDISSWAIDYIGRAKIECRDNRAIGVRCYNPEYTFVEKLSAISSKFRQQQEKGAMDRNFMRHYYDVFMLLQRGDVKRFIGTGKYKEHKGKKFRSGDEKDLRKNEAFIMSDNEVFSFYNEKFIESLDLYYRGQPSFREILDQLKLYLSKL